MILDAVALAQFGDGSLCAVFRHSVVFQNLRSFATGLEDTHEHRFHGYIFVTHGFREIHSLLQGIVGFPAQKDVATADFRQRGDSLIHSHLHSVEIGTELLEYEVYDCLTLRNDGFQQVDRFNLLLPGLLGEIDGFLDNFLRFDCEVVKIHIDIN